MRIRWTPPAAADLQNISDYLREHHPQYRQPTKTTLATKCCPNFALSRHRNWANRGKCQHDDAMVRSFQGCQKMQTINDIATVGEFSQTTANVGRISGICFATMRSGVRASPSPPISFSFNGLTVRPIKQNTRLKPCDPKSGTSGHHV